MFHKALLIIASLAASLVLGAIVFYAAVEALPCRWFGSGFEGGCAYGVLWASIAIGLLTATGFFAFLLFRLFRR